jgi:Polyketide cyclase / dehydrase and lipid transport
MNPTAENLWRCEYDRVTSASPEAVWRLFCDVPGWKRWNDGIEEIVMNGPFAAGTTFLMTPPGQETFTSVLVDVRPFELFVDETRVGDLVVRVAHRIERLDGRSTRVVYSVEAVGEGAAEVGPLVSADFPQVLKRLSELAESSG